MVHINNCVNKEYAGIKESVNRRYVGIKDFPTISSKRKRRVRNNQTTIYSGNYGYNLVIVTIPSINFSYGINLYS